MKTLVAGRHREAKFIDLLCGSFQLRHFSRMPSAPLSTAILSCIVPISTDALGYFSPLWLSGCHPAIRLRPVWSFVRAIHRGSAAHPSHRRRHDLKTGLAGQWGAKRRRSP